MKKTYAFMIALSLVFSAQAAVAAVGGGDLNFTPPNAKPVFFSHEQHVKAKGLKCSGCHYHAFQMAQGSYKMEMNKITKGQFCGVCHNGERYFDVKDPANCGRCHK